MGWTYFGVTLHSLWYLTPAGSHEVSLGLTLCLQTPAMISMTHKSQPTWHPGPHVYTCLVRPPCCVASHHLCYLSQERAHTVESWAVTILISQVSLLSRTTCNLYHLLVYVGKVCMCFILLYSHFGGRANLAPVHLSWLQRESLGVLFYCEYFALKVTEFF